MHAQIAIQHAYQYRHVRGKSPKYTFHKCRLCPASDALCLVILTCLLFVAPKQCLVHETKRGRSRLSHFTRVWFTTFFYETQLQRRRHSYIYERILTPLNAYKPFCLFLSILKTNACEQSISGPLRHCHAGLGIRAGYMFWTIRCLATYRPGHVAATSSSPQAFSLLPGTSGIGSLDRGWAACRSRALLLFARLLKQGAVPSIVRWSSFFPPKMVHSKLSPSIEK